MKLPKIKWKTSEKPTGSYASSQHRSWPIARWQDEKETPCASIIADKEYGTYRSHYARQDDVGFDLKIMVALKKESTNESPAGWEWKTLVKRARSIKQVKQIVADFWKANPHLIPDAVKEDL